MLASLAGPLSLAPNPNPNPNPHPNPNQVLASLAGPLSELRAARLAAKTARRKGERAKRRLLAYALRRCLVGGGICGDGGGGCGGGDGGISSGDGLFLEFGVASGGSINFLAERVPDGTRFGYRVIGIGFGLGLGLGLG